MGGIFQPAKDPGPVTAGQLAALNFAKANKTQSAWTVPNFENGWGEFSPIFPVGYFVDDFGFCHLRGLVSAGIVGVDIFNIPFQLSHEGSTRYATASDNLFGVALAERNGSGGTLIRAAVGSSAWFSLDGIVFQVNV